jgi:glutamine synthetase
LGSTSPAFIWGHYVFQLFYFLQERADYKTPLLPLQVMDEAATDVCKYFDKM